MKKPLIPVDKKQCQAEKPNGYSFMTLGGAPGRERCMNAPSAIITETKPGKDGRIGSMSLCQACWLVAAQQLGPNAFTSRHVDCEVELIPPPTRQQSHVRARVNRGKK